MILLTSPYLLVGLMFPTYLPVGVAVPVTVGYFSGRAAARRLMAKGYGPENAAFLAGMGVGLTGSIVQWKLLVTPKSSPSDQPSPNPLSNQVQKKV